MADGIIAFLAKSVYNHTKSGPEVRLPRSVPLRPAVSLDDKIRMDESNQYPVPLVPPEVAPDVPSTLR